MDWYMCRDGDGIIVPQDQESSEQSLSQDNSFQWEEGLSICGELPVTDYGFWNSETRLLGDWLDYQLDGASEMDQMNDNFISTLLEEDPFHMKNTYQSIGIFPEPEGSMMPSDHQLTDLVMDSQSIARNQSRRGNMKYLKGPSSMEWNKLNDPPTYMPCNSEKSIDSLTKNEPVSEINTSIIADGQADEQASLEATTLQELEGVMTQMTQETRICFRDALYRLAKSSKQQQLESQGRSGEHSVNDTSRFGEVERMESETNIFESTVAHLMFNELNCNTPDLYSV